MEKSEKTQRSFYLEKSTFDELDRYAARIKISRNKLMENLIDAGLEDLKLMEKTGMLAIGIGINDVIYKLRHRENRQSELEF